MLHLERKIALCRSHPSHHGWKLINVFMNSWIGISCHSVSPFSIPLWHMLAQLFNALSVASLPLYLPLGQPFLFIDWLNWLANTRDSQEKLIILPSLFGGVTSSHHEYKWSAMVKAYHPHFSAKIQYTICLTKILENMLRFCLTRIGLRKQLTQCCHPKPRPPSPSILGDISLFLYRKEKSYLATGLYFQRNNISVKVKVWVTTKPDI